ncbi:class II fructose-bisphosphatase [Verrucomicrobiaceae bacterium R5-34]|uniref:Fructose-1,6-bisphosphatase n=2 Tax=Oceaniferula flava TaxID=2800421 RepID=A0AAE2S939_9BACT|nr:class II fructose-bisphosphatase [Verrucomicrobiaceae bacterium R5-34]MBK1853336.1 class II fructose-bisphosphatase [Oceaniferula flavus]MBM1134641.1 class II fructose-bisphosphatase [Oceaniferula flavus]
MLDVMTSSEKPADPERIIEFEFLRATEAAALNAMRWAGRGEKESADEAACDAIRGIFDLMDIRGEVVIGEGIKDEAPGLFKGEKVGKWGAEDSVFDIALDPVDGTTNISKGMPNSIACIAAAIPEEGSDSALQDIPAFYMTKLAYPQKVRLAWMADPSLPLSLDAPFEEVIKLTARILEKDVRDIVVMVLDRPRNQPWVDITRKTGAQLRMIADGDITAALAPAFEDSGIDLYVGIGGSPEGVLSAAGLRCLGGGMQAKIWVSSEEERESLIKEGWGDRLDETFRSKDLAQGSSIIFCATGITDSPLLNGIKVTGHHVTTHSVLMRAKSRTVRYVEAVHNLEAKTIRLRSTGKEESLLNQIR